MTTILPRRYLHHPTLQPIHRSMSSKRTSHRVHASMMANVTTKSIAETCGEYRESAALLRQLGQDASADLLARAADAFEASARAKATPATSARTIAAHLAKMNEDYEETTVVADLPLPGGRP